jgi:hypothetical protein
MYCLDSGSRSAVCRSSRRGTLTVSLARARSCGSAPSKPYCPDSGSRPAACRSCRPGTAQPGISASRAPATHRNTFAYRSHRRAPVDRPCTAGWTRRDPSNCPSHGPAIRPCTFADRPHRRGPAGHPCRPDPVERHRRMPVSQVLATHRHTFACRPRRWAPAGHPCRLGRATASGMCLFPAPGFRRSTFACRRRRRAPAGHPCRPDRVERHRRMPASQVPATRRHMFAYRPHRPAPVDHPCRLDWTERHPGMTSLQDIPIRPDMFSCRPHPPVSVGRPCRPRPRGSRRIGKSATTRKKIEPLRKTCSCPPLQPEPPHEPYALGEPSECDPNLEYIDEIELLTITGLETADDGSGTSITAGVTVLLGALPPNAEVSTGRLAS